MTSRGIACACVVAASLGHAGAAHADLPRPGIYLASGAAEPPDAGATPARPFFPAAQRIDRLVLAVNSNDKAVKLLVARRGPAMPGEPDLGSSSSQIGGDPPCKAYGAEYETTADATIWAGLFRGAGFCDVQLDLAPASVSLKDSSNAISRFDLSEARPYVDIVPVPRQAFFYNAPDVSKRGAAYVVADDQVAVLQETEDWLLVDYFGPRNDTRGWLRREDFVRGPWVAQRQAAPRYAFAAACTVVAGGGIDADAIEIKERATGRRSQILYDLGVYLGSACEDVVSVVDANFDGYPDFSLRAIEGNANYMDTFYLYNPVTRQFEFSNELSQLDCPEVDPAKKEIRAGGRNGAMEHQTDRYRFVNGRLTLLESVNEKCGIDPQDPGQCLVTTRRLVRGAYVETQVKKREPF